MNLLLGPTGILVTVLLTIMAWAGALYWLGPARMELVDDLFGALAILLGGIWTFYQFALRRAFESILNMDLVIEVAPAVDDERFAVFVQLTLRNCGARRITSLHQLDAKRRASLENSVWYPCDLEIRKCICGSNALAAIDAAPAEADRAAAAAHVRWWDDDPCAKEAHAHTNLLIEYTDDRGHVDFFMEPGEQYHLGNLFLLEPGDYLAKVVFVGNRLGVSEFWSRIVHFQVTPAR